MVTIWGPLLLGELTRLMLMQVIPLFTVLPQEAHMNGQQPEIVIIISIITYISKNLFYLLKSTTKLVVLLLINEFKQKISVN
jgi:hypothetical protein